jgi:hypothetical protein
MFSWNLDGLHVVATVAAEMEWPGEHGEGTTATGGVTCLRVRAEHQK